VTDIRQVINVMPLRGGLATAGRRSSINEAQLWEAINAAPDIDGMIRRRPGSIQHGQTLTYPSSSAANAFYEDFFSLNKWDITDAGSDATYSVSMGALSVNQSTGDLYISRQAEDVASGGSYALKFSARLFNPAGDDTTGGSLRIQITGDSASDAHEYAINANGVFVLEGAADVQKYTPTYKLDLSGYHSFEIYYSVTTDQTTFWIDGVAQTAWDMSSADDVKASLGTTKTVKLWITSGTNAWTLYLTDLQYANSAYTSGDPPFAAQRLVDGFQYLKPLSSGGGSRSILLAATEKYLYADISETGGWRPIKAVQSGHTRMIAFQDEVVIFDDDGSGHPQVFSWNGTGFPLAVGDAPPVRFGAEFKTRLLASGDHNFPLRVYYTASRQLDVWFAPEYDSDETFDEVIQAGYIEIPSVSGDKVTGIYGDFLGSAIITTEKGIWQWLGSSSDSFRIDNISRAVGGSSPEGFMQIGNQLFIIGPSGVSSLQSVQSYGDLQTTMPSGAIADKWSSLPEVQERVDRGQLEHSYARFLPSLNVGIIGMRGQGQTYLDKMFAFAPSMQNWLGPWDLNPTFLVDVETGSPKIELLMQGDEQGRVFFTGLREWSDMGSSYQFKLSSPMFSGRSLDPMLTTLTKRWRTLRLFILPQVDKDFTVRWKTEAGTWQPDDSGKTLSQNRGDWSALNTGFRLNIDRLKSQEDVLVIDIPLEARGKFLQFEIASDYHFAIQGYQIEFLHGGKEE